MNTSNQFDHVLNPLLSEESRGSRLEIPASLREQIKDVQDQFRSIFKNRITREKVILLLIVEGIEGLQSKLCEIEAALESLEE